MKPKLKHVVTSGLESRISHVVNVLLRPQISQLPCCLCIMHVSGYYRNHKTVKKKKKKKQDLKDL